MPIPRLEPGPTQPSPSIWEQIWRTFSGTRNFFGKIGVILDALYALTMAAIKFAIANLKKVLVVVAFVVTLVATITYLFTFLPRNPRIAGIVAIAGVFLGLAWWLKKRLSKGPVVTFGNKPIPIVDLFRYLLFIAIVVAGVLVAIYYSWKPVVFVIGFLIALSAFLYGKKKVTSMSDSFWRSEFFIAIVIMIGIAVLNWLTWTLVPKTWEFVWADQERFWSINLGALVGLCLLLVPNKDKDGKKIDGTHFIAKWLSTVILGMTLLVIAKMALDAHWVSAKTPGGIVSRTPVNNLSHSVPMEIALRVIAECESGGNQFEPDGKTPLKNKEGSSAIGKYQILASDHEERAKKMGFDIRTEEGNEAYARVLYQESGTKHWEVDPRSKTCWEPKLRAYTWGGEAVSMVVVAPTDKWSDSIPTPYAPRKWELEGFGKKYKVLWNGETEEDFPQAQRVEKDQKIIYNFRVRSRETEPINIVVKFF